MEKLYCIERSNATILPSYTFNNYDCIGGVYSNGKPVFEALYLSTESCAPFIQAPYVEPQKYVAEDVIYAGELIDHFGHFLIVSLSRLWYAKKHPHIPIVWSKGTKYSIWQKEILNLLSIKNTPVFLDGKPTEFKKLYIPIMGFIHGYSFHPEYASFIGCYESQKPIKGKKVYVSRSNIAYGGYENELEIETFLKDNGWIIYSPELHSVTDQLYMFSSAEIVLGVESSAFHSLLLHKNIKSKIFCLHRVGHPSYQLIPSVKKINYSTIISILPENKNMPAFTKQYICDTKKLFAYLEETNFLEKDKPVDFVNTDYQKIKNLTYEQCTREYKNIASALTDKYYLASYALAQIELSESISLFHQALLETNAISEQRASIFFTLAHAYEANNDLDQAIVYAQKSINEINFSYLRHIYLTYLLRKKGDFTAATASAYEHMKILPWSSEAYNDMALICENKGELDEAIDYMRQALKREPLCFRKTVLAANLLFKKTHSNMAIELMLKYATLSLTNYDINESWQQLSESEKLKAAISVINEILKDNPNHFGSTIVLAHLLRIKGNYDGAITLITETMTLHPCNGEPHAQLAILYESKGEFNKAIEWLQKGIELEPQHLGRKKMLESLLDKII